MKYLLTALLCALTYLLGYLSHGSLNNEKETRAALTLNKYSVDSESPAFAVIDPSISKWSEADTLFSEATMDLAEEAMADAFIQTLMTHDPKQASVLIDALPLAEQQQYLPNLAEAWMNHNAEEGLNWLLEHESSFADDAEFLYRRSPMLVAYALQDPNAAYIYFKNNDLFAEDEYLYVNIATGLARQNFDDAFNYLGALPILEVSDHMLLESYLSVMDLYSEQSPQAAALVIQELESPKIQAELLEPIIDHFAQAEMQQATEWILGLSHTQSRTRGIEHLANYYGYQDPEGLFHIVLANQSQLSSDAVVSSFKVLADKDPETASTRISELSEEFKGGAAQALLSHWIEQNETEALAWLNTQPNGATFEGGAKVAADYYRSQGDYQSALAWISMVDDPAHKYDVYSSIVSNVDLSEMAHMQGLLAHFELSENKKQELRSALKQRLTNASAPLVIPE